MPNEYQVDEEAVKVAIGPLPESNAAQKAVNAFRDARKAARRSRQIADEILAEHTRRTQHHAK